MKHFSPLVLYFSLSLYTYIYIYIYTHTYIYIYIYIYICVCVWVCVCVWNEAQIIKHTEQLLRWSYVCKYRHACLCNCLALLLHSKRRKKSVLSFPRTACTRARARTQHKSTRMRRRQKYLCSFLPVFQCIDHVSIRCRFSVKPSWSWTVGKGPSLPSCPSYMLVACLFLFTSSCCSLLNIPFFDDNLFLLWFPPSFLQLFLLQDISFFFHPLFFFFVLFSLVSITPFFFNLFLLSSSVSCLSPSLSSFLSFSFPLAFLTTLFCLYLPLHLFINASFISCPVSWGFRIHWLHLCRGVRPHPNECPIYNTKQSDGEVLVMLDLWGMQSTPSLPSLPGRFCPGVVARDRVLSIGQIELNSVLMLNWITWNRTVFDIETLLRLNWFV